MINELYNKDRWCPCKVGFSLVYLSFGTNCETLSLHLNEAMWFHLLIFINLINFRKLDTTVQITFVYCVSNSLFGGKISGYPNTTHVTHLLLFRIVRILCLGIWHLMIYEPTYLFSFFFWLITNLNKICLQIKGFVSKCSRFTK